MSSSSQGYPHLNVLHMSSWNLYDFPDLRNASTLLSLDLSNNRLRGYIPSWIWETEKSNLNLSFNLLTGLKKSHISPNFSNSVVLLANNRLTGMTSSSFCNASLLLVLDWSFNNLSGSILIRVFPYRVSETDKLEVSGGKIPSTALKTRALKTRVLSQRNNEDKIKRKFDIPYSKKRAYTSTYSVQKIPKSKRKQTKIINLFQKGN